MLKEIGLEFVKFVYIELDHDVSGADDILSNQ